MQCDFMVNLEIVGTCNLKCPSCAVGNAGPRLRSGSIGGTMTMELYESILAKLASELLPQYETVFIALYSWGEPLIHPNVGAFVELAKQAGFHVGLSSNLNYARTLEAALEAEPDEFVVSLSGFSQEVYKRSHTGGNIEVVKANMQRMSQIIRERNLSTEVFVHYHCYRHNTGQDILDMAQLCEALNFTFMPGIAYYMPVENMIRFAEDDPEFVAEDIINELLVPMDRQIEIAREEVGSPQACELITKRLDIDVDGAVKLCCSSYDRANLVSSSYLQDGFDVLQERRGKGALCGPCARNGIDRIYTLQDYDQWRELSAAPLEEKQAAIRFHSSGFSIADFRSEDTLLSQSLDTLNSGDLGQTEELLAELMDLVASKYGDELRQVECLLEKLKSGVWKRGRDIPRNPLQLFFIEAVLYRNNRQEAAQAKHMLGRLIEACQLLSADAAYREQVGEVQPILEEWRALPV